MLQAIVILGGWLRMMGQHDRSESLFYYFRLEDQVQHWCIVVGASTGHTFCVSRCSCERGSDEPNHRSSGAGRLPSGALSSTKTNQPDNVRGSWSTRQSSPKHSGKERRWKPCSRN